MAEDDGIVVRLKRGKKTYEILTNHGTVAGYRKGTTDWDAVPVVEQVFRRIATGDVCSHADLKEAFDTDDVTEAMQLIATKGELQLTTADRKAKLDEKRAAIVNHIHKYYVNPKTKKPYLPSTIEKALDQLKLRVDADASVTDQVAVIVRKLPEVMMPVLRHEIEGTLFLPMKVLGAAQGVVHKYAQVKSEEYNAKGCSMHLGVVPGDFDEFMSSLSGVTKNEHTFDVIGAPNAAAAEEPTGRGKGKGKGKKGRRRG